MFTKRIIPCLDVNNGRVVKGVNFVQLRDAGDPVEIAKAYDAAGADELVFLDITASCEQRDTVVDMVRRVAANVFIPFTVGGGIRTVDDFKKLLREGADKISVNSAAIDRPDLIDFMCYCFYNQNFKVENLGFKKSKATMANWGIKAIEWVRKPASEALAQSRHFAPPADIRDLAKMASPIVSTGNQTGEGWFLTGEMMELIHGDVPNIVCIQPFGCLPNHIVGKGVIKEIRREYPTANIVAIDYDPGASEVNQLNRIKLMLSTAQKNLKKVEEKNA